MDNRVVRSRYVMTGTYRTHYLEAGSSGPTVVMCHGGGPGGCAETGFGRLMPLLADDFQLYALDGVGGFGLTDSSFRATEGSQNRVDQLELFMDVLCIERAALVGNSQGAWVAAKYALEHPDRVSHLCLTGSNTIPAAMGLKVPPSAAAAAVLDYDGSEAAMRVVLEGSTNRPESVTPADVELRQRMANGPGVLEAQKVFRDGQRRLVSDPNLRLKFELGHSLPRLQKPGLVLWGADDAFVPMEVGRQLEPLLPQFRFEFIPNAGHAVHHDQAVRVATLLRQFFTS